MSKCPSCETQEAIDEVSKNMKTYVIKGNEMSEYTDLIMKTVLGMMEAHLKLSHPCSCEEK